MKSTFLTLCFSLFSFLPLGAAASQTAADELIRKISDDVLHILVTDEALRGGDTHQAIGLVEQGSDGWKVFDVVIAGASLVSNYRGTFAQRIHTGGIDGLIDSLETKGRENAQGSSGRS